MGYLNDAWAAYDGQLAAAESSPGKRECMRIAFYLGVKAMLEAMTEAADMERAEFLQFMGEIAEEWRDFQLDCAAQAFAMISERAAAKMGAAK